MNSDTHTKTNENISSLNDPQQFQANEESILDSSAPRILDVFEDDKLLDGCSPIFMSSQTQQIFNLSELEESKNLIRYKLINKKDILQDFYKRAAVSDFTVKKAILQEYPGTEILLIEDKEYKFGQNFILVLTEEAKKIIFNPLIEPTQVLDGKSDNPEETIEEADDDVAIFSPPVRIPWISQGSEHEIISSSHIESRPKIATIYQKKRKYFGSHLNLKDRNSSTKGACCVIASYEDRSFDIQKLELDKGVFNTHKIDERGCNTNWKYPRNAIVQYYPRTYTPELLQVILKPGGQFREINKLYKLFEAGIKQNIMFDFLFDDYINLASGDDTYDTRADNTFKEYLSLTDLKYSKEKSITCIQWHPTIKGIIAISVSERLDYDHRLDQMSKLMHIPSYIIFWSSSDPIQPQLLLEAPDDVICFQFNPTDPQIIAGGCINGQVALWDIGQFVNDLTNVKQNIKQKIKPPLFSFDDTDLAKVSVSPCCCLSSIEHSHSKAILDIQWVPDHFEVNRLGYAIENQTQKCVQLMTCAIDHEILFWDSRLEKTPLAIDKTRDMLTLPHGVPATFSGLDMKWKPFLRAHIFNESGGDHSPTRFCIKEMQGDRRVINNLVNEKPLSSIPGVNVNLGSGAGGGGGGGSGKPGSGKMRALPGVSTFFYIGTEDGELVYVDWMPHKDQETGKMITPKPEFQFTQHEGPISFLRRSPFMPSIILMVGGWTWSIWKECVHSGPLLSSCYSVKPVTGAAWSPTRASVFYLTRSDGSVEVWDLLDKTNEPIMGQSVSSVSLTAIALWTTPKKQLLAVGDANGALQILIVPQRLRKMGPNDYSNLTAYIGREIKRREYVLMRWALREQERVEKENEAKLKAGISVHVQMTDDEILAREQRDYAVYLDEEKLFLNELGLGSDE